MTTNPIIDLFKHHLAAGAEPVATVAIDGYDAVNDQELAALANSFIDIERTATEFLAFLTAWATGDDLPDGPHSDALEAFLLDNDLARASETVLEARTYLAHQVLGATTNPVLVAFRESLTRIGGSGAKSLYGVALDLLDGLGGPGPEFDFTRYESASTESQVDAERATSDAEVAQARLVLQAFTLSHVDG